MIQLTREQQAAVYAPGDSIAVVAGAGTGKTRVLTERYLHLVHEGADIRRILAVTFTEKAAREMKERIRDSFDDPERARQVEFAPISTIHAFLARVLRERALDAGVDPRFAIADEITAELLLEQAMAEAVEANPDDALLDLSEGEDFLRALYKAARATPLDWNQLAAADVDPDALRGKIESLLAGCDISAGGKTGEKLKELVARRDDWLAFEFDGFVDLVNNWRGDAVAGIREQAKELKQIVKAWPVRDAARRVSAAVVALLADIDARFTALKRDDGLLDFSDLEHVGLRLLRDCPEVAADYDHVLVDEYQDTSLIQKALLDAIAAGRSRFGVGDIKQSIYRFRYADADVFAEFQRNSDKYPLSGSFRTRPEIVGFVNDLFRRLFADTGVPPQDLRAAREWEARSHACVELLSPEADRAPKARRREADALATRIRQLVEQERVATYKECALLLPRMSNLALYERALADRGMPYVIVKGRGYYAAREVVELANLLLLLEDPCDRFRGVCVMTSLLCGVPEIDLLWLGDDLLGSERSEHIPSDRWARIENFRRRFTQWQDAMGRVDTGTLVEQIFEQTRFADLMLLEPDGRRRHANLKKVLRQARQTRLTAPEFARGLLEFREREVRESEAPVSSEDDNAIRIMTVHASKGLEFKLVAVADLTRSDGGRRGPVLDPNGRFGLKVRRGEKTFAPPGYDDLKAWDKRCEDAEERRLWYVALTRAEEHLIVSWPRYPRGGNPLLDPLLDAPPPEAIVLDAGKLAGRPARTGKARAVRAALRRGADLPDLDRDVERADELLARVGAYAPPREDRSPYIAAVADLVEFDRCPRRYRLKRMLGIELELPPEHGGEAPDSDEHPRRILGTAFHKVIAEIGPGVVPDEATVKAHFPEARTQDVAKIIEWCAWFADQPLAERLRDAKHTAEMDFLVRIAGLPVRGTIDLYSRSLPLLLDWKTSRKPKPEDYALQVAIYLEALRSLELPCPDHGMLVYVDAGEICRVDPVPLEPLIAAFKDAHATGFEPKQSDACDYCDFRSACFKSDHCLPSQ
ncbi:MAG: UvrD-helicase domain-containing protein [Planctomycetota bacterium]